MTGWAAESRLATARLHWQRGDWAALAALPETPPAAGRLNGAAIELLLYKLQGLFLTGDVENGRALAVALQQAGVGRRVLIAALLSGAHSNAARAWMVLHHRKRAEAAVTAAISLNPVAGELETVTRIRADR